MKQRLIFNLMFVIAVTLALASPVWAGGVIVSLDSSPADVQAGVPFDVGFTIMSAHDGSSFPGLKPIVTASNAATGEKITVTAADEGDPGHYSVTLTLPSEGKWEWGIQPFGKQAQGEAQRMMTSLQLSAPRAVPVVEVESSAPPTNTIAFDAAVLPVIALIVVAASVATLGLVRMRRRAVAR